MNSRLVNAYIVRSVRVVPGKVYVELGAGADGIPARALDAARRAGAVGIAIHDVDTGERWLVPA